MNYHTYKISSCFARPMLSSANLTNVQFVGEISQGWRYNFWFSIIRHPHLPPIFTISPKVADNRGNTVYISKSFFSSHLPLATPQLQLME